MINKYLKGFTLGLLALSLSLMSFNAYAQVDAGTGPDMGNDSGNGGGGVKRNGRYMTFYSAGFYTEPVEAVADEVAQLPQLIHFFNTTDYMSELTKVKYARELIPSPARKYYKVSPNSFTPEIRARLVEEYERVMSVDTSEVALFAITDTNSKTTYLFPEFFSLTAIEQQAILFHEAYWLVHPNATYQKVISAEMAFQAFREQPQSVERLLRWLELTGTLGDVLSASVQSDLRTDALKGLERRGKIKLQDLLGESFFNCKNRNLGSECLAFIGTHIYQLRRQYPNSLFLRFVEGRVAQQSIYLDRSCFARGFYNSGRRRTPVSPGICRDDYSVLGRISTRDRNNGMWNALANAHIELQSANYIGKPQLSIKFARPFTVERKNLGLIMHNHYTTDRENLVTRVSRNKYAFQQLYLIFGRN